jgi:hypothetical protein
MRLAKAADYEVAWVPLREDIRNLTFDRAKAWDFFNKIEGDPYGHGVQLFSIIDTEDDNYFAPFSAELLPFLIRYLEHWYPRAFESLLMQGLNKRLGVAP